MMAAIVNGAMIRRDKRPFKAEDFWPAEAWDEPAEPPPPKPGAKPKSLAPDFSGLRGMKYGKVKKG